MIQTHGLQPNQTIQVRVEHETHRVDLVFRSDKLNVLYMLVNYFSFLFPIKGNVKAMELLINAGADVNAQDNQWNTPLHISAGGNAADRPSHFSFSIIFVVNFSRFL